MEPSKQIFNKDHLSHAKEEEEQSSTPVNYEWPPTPAPNNIYYCVIA